MSNFVPADYVDVAERIHRFYEMHPEGSIQTSMERLEGNLVVFKALAYKTPTDPTPTTGWAYEREGQGHVNKTSFIENCETSAIGRALANMGFAVKDGEPRPSRQEMEKVQRMSVQDRATQEWGLEPENAPQPVGQSVTRCPNCQGAVWDNARMNEKRQQEGKKSLPLFSCKDKDGCGWVMWPEKGRRKTVTAEASGKPTGSPFDNDDADLGF